MDASVSGQDNAGAQRGEDPKQSDPGSTSPRQRASESWSPAPPQTHLVNAVLPVYSSGQLGCPSPPSSEQTLWSALSL